MPAHQARKRFGQHFLVDRRTIQAIAHAVIWPSQSEHLRYVEIGPGLAALTKELVALIPSKHFPLTAIEIDRDLVARLRQQFPVEKLQVIQADALQIDFDTQLKSLTPGPCVIAGNLPYNISSPLLIHLISARHQVLQQVFMLQREVALRMIGQPNTTDYGRLSVMLQAFYSMELLFDVPPEAFDPPPKVDSSVVRMVPWDSLRSRESSNAPPRVHSLERFEKLLTVAFSQRRKMLRGYLFPWLEQQGVEPSGIDGTERAEQIQVNKWIELANRWCD